MNMTTEMYRKLIEKEDKFLEGNPYPQLGWETYELGITPPEIRHLVNDGICRIVYRSNKHCGYLLNRDKIHHLIDMEADLHGTFTPANTDNPPDLFGSIYGFDDIKANLAKFIASGKRGGFLFIGPPASAKTLFLLEIDRLPNAVYVTASNTTKASMRDLLIEDEPRFLCIDEIDKASARDYDTLLSLLETGIVQKNTHYGRTQKVLTTQVFAAANRDEHIPPEIKSRFITLYVKPYTPEELRDVGMYILTRREGLPDDVADYVVTYAMDQIHVADVRDFRKIANLGRTIPEVQGAIALIGKYSRDGKK